jgi:nitrogen regulatory protein PII
MHMIMFVLNDPDKLDEILDAWHEAGIDGATIVESTGIYRRRPHLIGARYTFGFPPLFESSETGNYTLFTIVSDEGLIERCIRVTEEIVGDLDIPNSGVLAVWPLSHAKGHAKGTRHNQSGQEENARLQDSDDDSPTESEI